MIGRTLLHYRVLQLLGEGGMGAVYLAEDAILKRRVALKILRQETAANGEWLQRFQREAELLAALNHPHIVTIHSLEECEGVRFLTMEWIEGDSLDRIMSHKTLTLPQSLDFGIAMADALSAAHERGIVHRDIKPANVMQARDGRVKVLDFGLARLDLALGLPGPPSLAAEAVPSDTTVSIPGAIAGTPAYMSPEQLRSDSLDHRTDIFSLGVVLYEMVAGRHPFRGSGQLTVMEAILRRTPVPLTDVRRDVLPQLATLISCCLEKDREERMQSSKDVRNELRRIRRGSEAGSAPGRPRAAFVETPARGHGIEDRFSRISASPSRDEQVSLAVLPFADMSAAGDQEYFSDGLSEELLNALASVPGLRLTARTSSFAFKGKNADVRQICRRLNVGAALEGSVRIQGSRARIRTQLINAEDGFRLWSETFDRELNDIFAVQEEIAQSVAGALKLRLMRPAEPSVTLSVVDLVAHDAYLQGNYFYARQRPGDIEKSIEYFQRVVTAEPGHAPGWAALSKATLKLMDIGHTPIAKGLEKAREAITRALALDNSLSAAHATYGYLKMAHEWDWAGAATELELALAQNRSDAGVLRDAAMLARTQGSLEHALALSAEAVVIDPLNARSYMGLGFSHWYLGHTSEAKTALDKVVELAPEYPYSHLLLGVLALDQDECEIAHRESNLESVPAFRLQGLAMTSARVGREEEGEQAFRMLRDDFADTMALQIAEVYTLKGEPELAFQWLERAYEQRDNGLADLKVKPLLSSLRGEQRFARLMGKMGLPL
jgi:eukaryotic-like serine/threonine-protein kinase